MALSGTRILLADDDEELLDLLREWLSHFGGQVAVAKNGYDALTLAKRGGFDVVVADLKMPVMGGHELLSLVKELAPSTQVIILSGQGTMLDAIAALREGRAFDFLQKPLQDLRHLNAVIERALEQQRRNPRAKPLPEGIEPLTEREHGIMRLLAEGLDNQAVAERLFLSEKTVKNHLSRIYDKLRVTSRTQAVLFCQQHRLL